MYIVLSCNQSLFRLVQFHCMRFLYGFDVWRTTLRLKCLVMAMYMSNDPLYKCCAKICVQTTETRQELQNNENAYTNNENLIHRQRNTNKRLGYNTARSRWLASWSVCPYVFSFDQSAPCSEAVCVKIR